MRTALRRVAALIWLITAGLCLGQKPSRTPPEPDKEAPAQLGPVTAPTRDQAADAVKTPVGITPMPTAAPVDPKSYQIGPEDILLIRVWREPDLTTGVQVRPDGKIAMPLIGELQAAGNTPEQLKDIVIEKLSEYINKPEVM
ncbi:MAG: polysaccharide biosynthesis/export family protein, partial [Bryobacteraceae bacterium]|nr:polysaccharide biosynthesis/export family protein [Bryobacteraceae bacterium]